MIYGIAAFSSTHDALTAEKLLKPLVPVVMLPTPRCITASCGISLRFAPDALQQMQELLQPIEHYALYRVGDGICEKIVLFSNHA